MAHYLLVKRLGDGLVAIQRTSGDHTDTVLWASCRTRQDHTCKATGRRLPRGSTMYRPTGNTAYRYERLDATHVDIAPPGTML